MKTGVFGTGYWGPNIIRNLLTLNQEVIIYDINKANVQNTLQRFPECSSVNSPEEILRNPDITAVVISVPVNKHCDLIIKSLRSGKHVFVEKPLCYSLEEADRIEINLNGRVLMVGHITIFTPGTEKIRELINNNVIGELTHISLTRTHFGPVYHEIDVATEVASHDIAILLYLLQQMPIKINAWTTSRLGHKYQDNANIFLCYKGSLQCTINVQWTSVLRERAIVVEGTSGTIVCKSVKGKDVLTLYDQQKAFEALKNGAIPNEALLLVKSEDVTLKDCEPLYQELDYFLSCIENNRIPLTNFGFSRKVVTVSEAIRNSMNQNGKTQRIDDKKNY